MYEKEFALLEGREMSLVTLGRELENITGYELYDSTGELDRVIALKPNFSHDWETYRATYRLKHRNDYIDAVFTIVKDYNKERLKEVPVKIQLISYISKA
ncbi:hypothetical protein [Staphylococcus rostri]|uniref:Uncharacterized protein n=1 Tax=Staphylococcus rostri TaxID=522262 RepID=A0A2K3YPK4_9STAP|nr:hypothetical protein [Staphylococcus rostri]PNZ27530.1 hypothetical protein CD122_06025 [Staphylococcus rostri]